MAFRTSTSDMIDDSAIAHEPKKIQCNLCSGTSFFTLHQKPFQINDEPVNRTYSITDSDFSFSKRIISCENCGLTVLEPPWERNEIHARYESMVDQNYLMERNLRRKTFNRILSRIRKFSEKGKLLDVGCSTGILLDLAKTLGWDPYGVEMSDWAIKIAQSLYQLDVSKGPFEDVHFPREMFDVVTMVDSIEHVTDPRKTLEEIHRILKKGGILYINTPDIGSLIAKALGPRWWGFRDAHLYYFSSKTLIMMLKDANFRVLELSRPGRSFSVSYWISRFEYFNKTIHRILKPLENTKIARDTGIYLNFGDQIGIVAQAN